MGDFLKVPQGKILPSSPHSVAYFLPFPPPQCLLLSPNDLGGEGSWGWGVKLGMEWAGVALVLLSPHTPGAARENGNDGHGSGVERGGWDLLVSMERKG